MLNVITLFSGYDSQCLALNRLGVEYNLVAWCEIDKHAIKAHNALFPQYADRNLGDVANCVTSAKRDNTQNFVKENHYRIRRLTERELYRLMDVEEKDIDTLLSAGISKTQLAKMAGNSIVVNVLYHIFKRLLVDTEAEHGEQMKLF